MLERTWHGVEKQEERQFGFEVVRAKDRGREHTGGRGQIKSCLCIPTE